MNNEELRPTFEEAAKPLIQWLNEHSHPHAKVIVDSVSAELVSGEIMFRTHEYVKD